MLDGYENHVRDRPPEVEHPLSSDTAVGVTISLGLCLARRIL